MFQQQLDYGTEPKSSSRYEPISTGKLDRYGTVRV